MVFQMYQVVVEMCEVGFSFDLVFRLWCVSSTFRKKRELATRFKYSPGPRELSTFQVLHWASRFKCTSVPAPGKMLVLKGPPSTSTLLQRTAV